MARIQITDLNYSDSELMDKLTAEEILAINGGGKWAALAHAIGDILESWGL
jgi:hypothetical protein